MSVQLAELTAFLDQCFSGFTGQDHSNNGLQIEGKAKIRKVAFAVDACAQVFQAAADQDCDFVFCHHGLSWGGGLPYITGNTAERLKIMMNHGISLYAVHLPLDAHPDFGNNAQLAQILQVNDPVPFGIYHGSPIGYMGTMAKPMTPRKMNEVLSIALNSSCRLFKTGSAETISKVALISGGGADFVHAAAEAGMECLVTGEMLHQFYHEALEAGIHVISGGHYATETVGPKAVMAHVARSFPQLQVTFIDAPTGL
ncbi:MAG: Nif3-like dinuclear metal center hexameric protein [Victivallales bacterium]|nr:Nif3-like dinuclear metal center hexameric protein [Victivallales bacterium]